MKNAKTTARSIEPEHTRMRRMRNLALVLAAVVGIGVVAGAAAAQDQPLRVYTKPIEPFAFRRNGEPAGFSLELWEKIAEDRARYELHRRTVWKVVRRWSGASGRRRGGDQHHVGSRGARHFSTPFYESGLSIWSTRKARARSTASEAMAGTSPGAAGLARPAGGDRI
jgi:hypothetical protein